LTLNGTTKWPKANELARLGETRADGTPAKIRRILERVGEAVRETQKDVRTYIKEHPEFADVGRRMIQEWETGCETSICSI
jgi:hypothetical protein